MDTVVLQWSVGGSDAYYPTGIAGLKHATPNAVPDILEAAQQAGVSMHIGLVWDDGWWGDHSAGFLSRLANTTMAVGSEVWGLYHAAPAFAGIFLPPEIDNLNWQTEELRVRLATLYLRPVTDHLRALDPNLLISTAPFYNVAYMSAEKYAAWWLSTLNDAPNLDVLMLQDGVGAGHATVPQAAQYFAAFANATSRSKRQLWSDIEIFDMVGTQYSPASITRVVQQLQGAAPHVSKQLCFEFHADMAGSANVSLAFNYARYIAREPYPAALASYMADYTLSRPPSSQYADAPHKLTNGRAAFSWGTQVGWQGAGGASVTVRLARPAAACAFVAYFMHSHASGVTAPSAAGVATSSDGASFTAAGQLRRLSDADERENVYALQAPPADTAYVRFSFTPGAGAWVMCTQVEVYAVPQ